MNNFFVIPEKKIFYKNGWRITLERNTSGKYSIEAIFNVTVLRPYLKKPMPFVGRMTEVIENVNRINIICENLNKEKFKENLKKLKEIIRRKREKIIVDEYYAR